MIEVVADHAHAAIDTPLGGGGGEVGRALLPVVDHVLLVDITAQQQAVTTLQGCTSRLFQNFRRDGLAWHAMPHIGDHRVTGKGLQRQIVHLLATRHIVFRGIDMAAGMQAHMHAAHDLTGATRGVMLLDHFHLELHVLLEAGRGAHLELRVVQLEADVDDLAYRECHADSLLRLR